MEKDQIPKDDSCRKLRSGNVKETKVRKRKKSPHDRQRPPQARSLSDIAGACHGSSRTFFSLNSSSCASPCCCCCPSSVSSKKFSSNFFRRKHRMYSRWLLLLLFFGFYPRLDALRGTLGELSWVCLGEVVGDRISSRDIIKWVPCESRGPVGGGRGVLGRSVKKM